MEVENTQNQLDQQNIEQNCVFFIEGFYTKVIKEMFSALAKSAEKTSQDFHILVNTHSIAFIIRGRGGVTSTVLQLKDKFFNKHKFEPNQSNTASGFVMQVNMADFDLCYKLLDPGSENRIVIMYENDSSHLIIKQTNQEEDYNSNKVIKIDILAENQEEKDAISTSFIPDQQYPIQLNFPSGNAFKLVEKCFLPLKLENLEFHFNFQDQHSCKFFIQSSDNNYETFKISIDQFKKIKGDVQVYQYTYSCKLVLPAFSFLTKETEISLSVDENGTLIIVSKDNNANVQTETIIPTSVDSNN